MGGQCYRYLWFMSIFVVVIAIVTEIIPFYLMSIVLLALFVIVYRRRIYIIIAMLPRDLSIIKRAATVMLRNSKLQKRNASVVKLFYECVEKHREKPCFYFEDKIWTYAQVNEFCNRVANVFLDAGYGKGDVVALFMENCPEYICIWLGLAKLGITTALINTNLQNLPLVHSLNVAKAKAVIFSSELSLGIQEVLGSLDHSLEQYQLGRKPDEKGDVKNLDALIASASSNPPKAEGPGYKDKLLYIYTSGTTGLPKAAVLPHSRYLLMTMCKEQVSSLRAEDIIYNPLPLYHMLGGILGVGPTLIFGNPLVIRRNFSASAYWTDCIKYNCTIGLYIGEMCRYILSTPPKPEDSQHKVRLLVGNGMRPTIWKEFVERFKVKQIAEVYGSTEGNVSVANLSNKIGAIGSLPQFIPSPLLPVGIVRVDPNTYEPIRDKRGLCIRCKPDEPGMAVGLISPFNALHDFHGYVDKAASSKKVLHDVFKKGDKAFVTGDILVIDEYGYLYFKDRTGDTFRWKGENVSTAELETVIINVIGLRDAAIYGVEIPGHEGRAGMAAVVDSDNTLDLQALANGFSKNLPSYAQPVFIRVVKNIDMTETFKIKKIELQKEGFDPSHIKDKIYFRSGKTYVPLTPQLYQDILKGEVRV